MSIPMQAHYFYQFGPFQVDVANRLLLRDGAPVALPPKVFEALYVLVENSGRVLEKGELMSRLWPDCFVEEGNLTQTIFQLRKALGESGANQQYIETIPRRGYRFIAEIKMVNGELGRGFTHHHNGTTDDLQDDLQKNEDKVDEGSQVNEQVNGKVDGKDAIVISQQGLASLALHSQAPVKVTKRLDSRYRWRKVGIAALALLASIAVCLFYLDGGNPLIGRADAPFKKLPQVRKLTTSGNAQLPALSPKGNYVAYVLDEAGRQSIRIRHVNSTSEVEAVPPAAVTYRGITFSPDGTFIYYVILEKDQINGSLYQVPVLGGIPRKVLSWVDSAITFSPDGKRFAFVRTTDEQKESFLVSANADGSGEQQLAARKKPEIFSYKGLAWSPDGKMIASVAGRRSPGESNMSVVTVNPVDGSETRLGSNTWNWIESADWLKDGSGVVISAWYQEWPVFANQIWYLSYPSGEVIKVTDDLGSYGKASIAVQADIMATGRSERISRLWVAPSGDANRARVIKMGYGDNYSENFGLCWTPDGRLVYGSHASGNADIWVMDADGGNQKQLTFNPRRDVLPVISSDGQHIVYVSRGASTSYLWRMDADGRNPRQLTRGKGDHLPSLSPDGRWVVYSSYDESGKRVLWRVSIEGSEPLQLTNYTSDSPEVSPDGKMIACQILDEKTKRLALAILPFEGGDPIMKFCDMPVPAYELLRWTPDGRALTYVVTNAGVSNIWLQPIDGGRAKQITNFKEDQIFRMAWSRDGKNLAFDRGVTSNNIILISKFR
jgi:Tol biopolymer transport system component/DNA-binding winged helix-turn-helix (wHTH) protein